MVVGAGLGVVYAPCAGPILAGVITVTASQDFSAARFVVALAYAAGSAIAFFALAAGGRRLTTRLSIHSGKLRLATGAVMVLTATAMSVVWIRASRIQSRMDSRPFWSTRPSRSNDRVRFATIWPGVEAPALRPTTHSRAKRIRTPDRVTARERDFRCSGARRS